jgi:hypothetical protein
MIEWMAFVHGSPLFLEERVKKTDVFQVLARGGRIMIGFGFRTGLDLNGEAGKSMTGREMRTSPEFKSHRLNSGH